MAFIRRVRTRSGATAVQIAEHRDGRKRIVAHVGSAHTDAELGVLIEQAEQRLSDPARGVLGLDIETSARVRLVLSTGASERTLLHAAPPLVGTDGPGRVTGTGSQLLFDVLAGVYGDLGFGVLGDRVFCNLVAARIVEPTSFARHRTGPLGPGSAPGVLRLLARPSSPGREPASTSI